MPSPSTESRRGFTLIEVVVAFAIVALVTVGAFSALGVGIAAWTRGNAAVDRLRDRHTAVRLAREQLQAALPLVGAGGVLAFSGAPDRIDFVSATSIADGPSSIPRWIRWNWEPSVGPDRGGALEVSEHRILSPENVPETDPYWTGRLFAAGGVEFRYFQDGSGGLERGWVERWDPRDGLPAAVAIRFAAPDGDEIVALESFRATREGARLQ